MPRDDRDITQEIQVADQVARAPPRGERKPYLVAIAGLELGSTWPITRELVLGRAEVDVAITGGAVSRRHARVWLESGQPWIEDLGANNGTFVNGARVARAQLREGDRIEIGSATVLRVSYEDELEANTGVT